MGFIKQLFSPDIPEVQTPSITGRELVSQTSSEEPDSPRMGSSYDENKKKRGINSLLVQNENIYKGGV